MSFYIPPWLLIIALVLGLWVFFYQLWLHYLAVMQLKRAIDAGTLKPWAQIVGTWQVLPGGVLLDWTANMLPCTLIFWDLPASAGELVTGRLQRYVDQAADTWRKRWALVFAQQMLNDFDPDGPHVKAKGLPND